MAVEKSTAYEDARRALRCAIWNRHGKRIEGAEWISMSPGGDPPTEFGCNAQAWTRTLRVAAKTLVDWGYGLPRPELDEGESVVGESLQRSVRLLFESMTAYRQPGTATRCDDGGKS
jgi:hypothetical protein